VVCDVAPARVGSCEGSAAAMAPIVDMMCYRNQY
jgi:hypothetical protein